MQVLEQQLAVASRLAHRQAEPVIAVLGQAAPVQRLQPLDRVGDLADGFDHCDRQQGTRGEREYRERAPLELGERADAEPVKDLDVVSRMPGERPERMPALSHQRRALPEVQRLAVHGGHQAPGRGKFLGRKRAPEVASDQCQRGLFRQPSQVV